MVRYQYKHERASEWFSSAHRINIGSYGRFERRSTIEQLASTAEERAAETKHGKQCSRRRLGHNADADVVDGGIIANRCINLQIDETVESKGSHDITQRVGDNTTITLENFLVFKISQVC